MSSELVTKLDALSDRLHSLFQLDSSWARPTSYAKLPSFQLWARCALLWLFDALWRLHENVFCYTSYMKGEKCNHRVDEVSDVWYFRCVLFEFILVVSVWVWVWVYSWYSTLTHVALTNQKLQLTTANTDNFHFSSDVRGEMASFNQCPPSHY